MRLSFLFTKTSKQVPADEVALNAQLLIKGWFVNKEMAWVYTYLPLWWKVLKNIENIIRKHMNKIWWQEIYMPVLASKLARDATWRRDTVDVLFKLKWSWWGDITLNSTHEEIVTPIAKKFLTSYKDFPKYIYQIQTKFRDEPRAKSWLLRGREFLMKDLYSFHLTEEDLDDYYNKVIQAYLDIYAELWLGDITYVVEAPWWDFTDKPSHEFQTLTDAGEDNIWHSTTSNFAVNEELIEAMPQNYKIKKDWETIKEVIYKETGEKLVMAKAAEVGNIFKLYSRFSDAIWWKVLDKNQNEVSVQMWCYGIWVSRLMAVLVEVFNDKNGIIWPENIAPAKYIIVAIWENWLQKAEKIYSKLISNNIEVLFDDRPISPGKKLKDADLLWIPYQIIVSDKTLSNWEDIVELKNRKTMESKLVGWKDIFKL